MLAMLAQTSRRTRAVLLLAGLLAWLGVAAELWAQPGITGARFYVATTPGTSSQSTLRVDTSVNPNRTEIGCETDRLATTTVNCLRVAGAATGAAPTISAIAATGGDASIGITLTPLGSGAVTLGGNITTNRQFFSAVEFCRSDNTAVQMIPTRVAQSDWALAVTSAAGSTQNIHCAINLPYRTTASKGAKIDGVSISYFISTNALTTHTFNAMAQVVYANNVANAISNFAGAVTCTLATATQANPYLTACTVPTAAYIVTANTAFNLDFTAVLAAAATTYRVYGIEVTYSTALY